MRSDFYGLPYAAQQAIRRGDTASTRARHLGRARNDLRAALQDILAATTVEGAKAIARKALGIPTDDQGGEGT